MNKRGGRGLILRVGDGDRGGGCCIPEDGRSVSLCLWGKVVCVVGWFLGTEKQVCVNCLVIYASIRLRL